LLVLQLLPLTALRKILAQLQILRSLPLLENDDLPPIRYHFASEPRRQREQ